MRSFTDRGTSTASPTSCRVQMRKLLPAACLVVRTSPRPSLTCCTGSQLQILRQMCGGMPLTSQLPQPQLQPVQCPARSGLLMAWTSGKAQMLLLMALRTATCHPSCSSYALQIQRLLFSRLEV